MSQKSSLSGYFPRPLLVILGSIVPVAAVCYVLSQRLIPHPAPDAMTPQAIDARLQPIAHVFAAAGDVKVVASAESGAPAKN